MNRFNKWPGKVLIPEVVDIIFMLSIARDFNFINWKEVWVQKAEVAVVTVIVVLLTKGKKEFQRFTVTENALHLWILGADAQP